MEKKKKKQYLKQMSFLIRGKFVSKNSMDW